MGKKKKINIEPRTENVRFLTKRELKSFLSMMEERRTAIGDNDNNEILKILEFDEILHIEAVIFNGLVDAYMLGRKNHFRRIQLKLGWEGCLCPKAKLLK